MKTTTIYIRKSQDVKPFGIKARTFEVQLSTGLIIDVAIHRPSYALDSKKGWTSTEVKTGLSIHQTAEPTIKRALDKAVERMEEGIKQGADIEATIKTHALSK